MNNLKASISQDNIISSIYSCVTDNIVVISKALTSQFVIPEFKKFTDIIDEIYESCKDNTTGTVSVQYLQAYVSSVFY